MLQTVALCLHNEDDDLRDNAWHVFHELLACSGPVAEPMLALAAPPDSGAGSAVLVMDTPASPVVAAPAPMVVVPPFYERLGVCCAEPVKLKQVRSYAPNVLPYVNYCFCVTFWQAVTSRLATLGVLPPDEQERLASEREVCEALASMLQGI